MRAGPRVCFPVSVYGPLFLNQTDMQTQGEVHKTQLCLFWPQDTQSLLCSPETTTVFSHTMYTTTYGESTPSRNQFPALISSVCLWSCCPGMWSALWCVCLLNTNYFLPGWCSEFSLGEPGRTKWNTSEKMLTCLEPLEGQSLLLGLKSGLKLASVTEP